MLPSDFSIVFQPPMVVGQRPRATSPLPTRAYSVSVGRSLTPRNQRGPVILQSPDGA
jgi:hypothetical protein